MKGAAYGISDGICDRTPGGACRTPGSMDHQIDGVVGLHCSQIKVWLAGSVVKAVLYMRPTAAQCGQCSQHKDEDFQGNMDKQHILYFTVQHTKNVHLLGFHMGAHKLLMRTVKDTLSMEHLYTSAGLVSVMLQPLSHATVTSETRRGPGTTEGLPKALLACGEATRICSLARIGSTERACP